MYALTTLATTTAHLLDFRPIIRGLSTPLENISHFLTPSSNFLVVILVILPAILLVTTLSEETSFPFLEHYETELEPCYDNFLAVKEPLEEYESEYLPDTLNEYLLDEDFLFEDSETETPTPTSIINNQAHQTSLLLQKMRKVVNAMKELQLEKSLDRLRDEIESRTRMVLLEELGRLGKEELDERVYRLCRERGVRHRKIVWREGFVGLEGRIVRDVE